MDCGGGGNALASLSTHLQSHGHGHTQNHMAGRRNMPNNMDASMQRMRMGQSNHQQDQLQQEFFREEHQPHSDPFQFQHMTRELESSFANNLPQRPLERQHVSWADDFQRQQTSYSGISREDQHFQEFESIYARTAQIESQMPFVENHGGWASDFERFQNETTIPTLNPHVEAEFEMAFQEAQKGLDWTNEFSAQQPQSWSDEFKASEGAEDNVNITGESSEILSSTAGLLLETVKDSANPKFKESKFFGFMKQIRDQKVTIEGNKVVDVIAPVQSSASLAADWAKEFGSHGLNTQGWEEDFNIPPFEEPAMSWSDEFSHRSHITTQHRGRQNSVSWADQFADEAQKDMTSDEMLHMMNQAYDDAHNTTEHSKNNIMNETDLSAEWETMAREWAASQTSAQAPTSAYPFTQNNPYTSRPLQFLKTPESHRNITESILALEAAVLQNPNDAQSWSYLGLKQQENENDAAAISAFRQAVSVDPFNRDGWMGLAVSSTNEGMYGDAYDALKKWVEGHDEYKGLLGQVDARGGIDHEGLVKIFMKAARIYAVRGDVDADVQVALGLLFNISQEYNKAVDCFEAALSKIPQDYMLWNRLGATLANSNNAERALDAYSNALQINGACIRARYNIAIACIQLGSYREAAEHLIGALSIQENNIATVLNEGKGKNVDTGSVSVFQRMHEMTSESLWSTLKMILELHLNRPDLVNAVRSKDLTAFKTEF